MIVRHELFQGMPAFYTDSDTGELIEMTDRDLQHNRALNAETDRLTLQMCAHDRARGKALEGWQLDAEAEALGRMSDVAVMDLCREIRAGGGRLAGPCQERFSQALLRQGLAAQEVVT